MMGGTLYPRLAWNSIRKNRKLYLPYILTCIGMVAMFYIIAALGSSTAVASMKGARTATQTLGFGSWVVGIFSVIFLFYTNSFLMRRRRKEFGLYNILGMSKWNIGVILLWETLIIAALALVIGLVAGVVLLKYAEVILMRLMRGTVGFALTFSLGAVGKTAAVFGIIFLLILLNSVRSVHTANPIALLHSENVGEKPPRANWFLGVLGAVLLGGAYYLAVSIRSPLMALSWFFVAVVMVIVATYLLLIAGSVLLCRLLQRNRRYYYRSNHFVSVASMVYRMRRNGAGLASVCILATMVLVMISSTASLYFGSESAITAMYPQDNSIAVDVYSLEQLSDESLAPLRDAYGQVFAAHGFTPQGVVEYRYCSIAGLLKGNYLEPDQEKVNSVYSYDDLRAVYFVSAADYNRAMGTSLRMVSGEAYIHTVRCDYTDATLRVDKASWTVAGHLDSFMQISEANTAVVPSMMVVIADLKELQPLEALTQNRGSMLQMRYYYGYDADVPDEEAIAMFREQKGVLEQYAPTRDEWSGYSYYSGCIAEERDDFFGTFGGLFFLGILLSFVFLLATVLIIYYKQVTEGYEDQARFAIMQNVGMTKRDIRRSINSQMLTVFLLPPLTAVVHFSFAFPLIRKLLTLFNLYDLPLLLITAGISVAAFLVLYTVVYRITSNAYYSIVSGAKES